MEISTFFLIQLLKLLCFRYVLVRFSHYGSGLSHGFSNGKRNLLKLAYFLFLFSYISISFVPRMIKIYNGDYVENLVKGRACLQQRFDMFNGLGMGGFCPHEFSTVVCKRQ